ncbi:calcium-binding protein [uncultured Propionivibrio sp.]|uniref:calcium-binding protein n=1 Tax=uncultured Propionivibrio sp. TaxID=426737 RepID=UPI0029C0D81E|nr:calcium-binding protein [uncultured Propionivibrio sp.]
MDTKAISSLAETAWKNREQFVDYYEAGANVANAAEYVEKMQNNGQGWLCEKIASDELAFLAGIAMRTNAGAAAASLFASTIDDKVKFTEAICDAMAEFERRFPGKLDDIFPGPDLLIPRNRRPDPATGFTYQASRTAIPIPPRRDPLVLDLDGDGIETLGIDTTNPILFDHAANGVRIATGWLKSDDAFLVADRDHDGTIDSGAELFSDATPLDAGGIAADGFAALAQEDTTYDGVVDVNDADWANLRLWRDLNQDGIAQADELFTLASQHIDALRLARTAQNTTQANGNRIADTGVYVRDDASTGTMGDIDLVTNPFVSRFTDPVVLTDAARDIADMQGAGMVRSLREAASLDNALVADIQSLDGTTRSEMLGRLDTLLADWAGTSTQQTSTDAAQVKGYRLVYLPPGMSVADYWATRRLDDNAIATALAATNPTEFARLQALKAQQETLSARIGILERFNAQAFVTVSEAGITTGQGTVVAALSAAQTGGPATNERDAFVSLNTAQTPLLDQAYAALKQSAYDALAPQTRLSPYFDGIGLTIGENGFRLDYSDMEAALDAVYAEDNAKALTDFFDLKNYAKDVSTDFSAYMENQLSFWGARAVNEGVMSVFIAAFSEVCTARGGSAPMIVGGTSGNDVINSVGSNVVVYGGNGDDTITSGGTGDTVDGGAGDDVIIQQGGGANVLRGGDGNDAITYHYGGRNVIEGGAGDDVIKPNGNRYASNSTANTFAGNAGNDRIESGGSADTYLFNRGDGQDTINDYGYYYYNQSIVGMDRIVFGAGITTDDVTASRLGDSLVIKVSDPANPSATDRITIENWLSSEYRIEQVLFADGMVWTAADLCNLSGVGTDASETLTAWRETTFIDGKGGNDVINSEACNAEVFGGDGNDTITSGGTSDTVDGGAGDDVIIQRGGGANVLRGGEGNDTVTYNYCGNNVIQGGAGDDLIKPTGNRYAYNSTANTFAGNAGNDRIESGGSTDTYLFNRGDGQDTINDYGYYYYNQSIVGMDRIVFGAGITTDDVTASRLGDNLVIKVSDPANPTATDRITVENWLSSEYRIEQVLFADGMVWTAADLCNLSGVGTDASETLTAWREATFVYGKGGDDVINSVGSNAVVYGGDGNDTITSGGTGNTVDGGAGDDVIIQQGYGANVLRGGEGNDTVVYSYYASTVIEGGAGDDVIKPTGNRYAYNSTANTFAGNAGNDRIESGGSTDTYLFNRGDGQDTINDYGYCYYNNSVVGMDRVVFGAGITTADVTATRSGDNLVIKVSDPANPTATDRITVENWLSSEYRIEQVLFADGTVWTAADLCSLSGGGTDASETLTTWRETTFIDGKGGDDVINACDGNAVVYGGDGNDTITDSYGSDTIEGGAGDDVINDHGAGSNVLRGGEGSDTVVYSYYASNVIEGGAGDDVIKPTGNRYACNSTANTFAGNAGNDRIESGGSTDTYLFNRGDGQDTINDYGYYYYNNYQIGMDKIIFGPDITPDQLWFRHVGNNLEVDVIGTADSVTIENWYASSTYHIEQFKTADGKVLVDAQVGLLVQAMASFSPPPSGQTVLPQNCQEALTPVIVANWR